MKSGRNKANKKPAEQQKKPGARKLALNIILRVIKQGQSLSVSRALADELDSGERALTMEIVHGVLRWRWKLEAQLSAFMKKPLRSKDLDVQLVLLIALYEITELRAPDYAVVNEAVKLSKGLRKSWSGGLVNAVLRAFIRAQQGSASVSGDEEAIRYSHPDWLQARIRHDWPEQWQAILQANNQRPPLWLRVNTRQSDTQAYRAQLQQQEIEAVSYPYAGEALKLARSMDVTTLPGFKQGAVSVQDAGAQLAAGLLGVETGHRVLDLCAAPGGKTCHLLEKFPQLHDLLAVEVSAQRMLRLQDNLQRLKLQAETRVADASDVQSWWDGRTFDRIMLDAPCSSSGVIRRHPDIKSLRREEDITALVTLQQQILQQAWSMLASSGELLYITCSVFRDENENQIEQFLAANTDAEEVRLTHDWGVACRYGRQLLPGENDADGFYYAKLRKL